MARDLRIDAYCRDGDGEAFAAFYREQAPRLWKFLCARGCGREDAYDLLAEAFLRLSQTVCRDARAPRALLYRIAINLRIDAHRRERATPLLSAQPPEAAAVAEPDDHAQLRALVARLPAGEQNLLLLRYWIGLSHAELAQALGAPEGTVRRQCAQAMTRLRALWTEEETRRAVG